MRTRKKILQEQLGSILVVVADTGEMFARGDLTKYEYDLIRVQTQTLYNTLLDLKYGGY